MIIPQFKIEKSNIKTYLKTRVYKCSLFNFLNDHNMLKDKYKILVIPYTICQSLFLYIPIKMAKKMPLILAALTCEQIVNCLYKTNDLKLVKIRARNYCCSNLLRNLVSIFGNKKAWRKFEVNAKWNPKFSFVNKENYQLSFPFMPFFKLIRYEVDPCTSRNVIFTISVCWAKEKRDWLWKLDRTYGYSLSGINKVNHRKISRIMSTSVGKRNIRRLFDILVSNDDLITKDGIKLKQNLIRSLVL